MQYQLAELKKIVLDLQAEVKELKVTMPDWFSLGDIALATGTKRTTIAKYLKANFEQEVDFKYFGAKIFVSRDALFFIRKHYEK